MATIGKPSIAPLRNLDLRELQQVVANIRERLAVLDATVSALQGVGQTTSTTASATTASGIDRIGSGLVAKRGAGIYASREIVAPDEFDLTNADGVSGNPTFAWAQQPANLVFCAPDGALGPPTFRALTADDVAGIFGELLTNPMTEFGDLIFGQSAGSPGVLPIGTDGQFLTVVSGVPQWTTVAPGSGMANPMTTDGDIIFGQSAGSPARLAPGAEGDVLTISGGLPSWAAPAGGSGGMSNPMLDYGDMIVGQSAGSPARLAPGTEGQILKIVSGLPAWSTSAGGGSDWTEVVLETDFVTSDNVDSNNFLLFDLEFAPSEAGTFFVEWFLLCATASTSSLPRFVMYSGDLPGAGTVNADATATTRNFSNFTYGLSATVTAAGTARTLGQMLTEARGIAVAAGAVSAGTGWRIACIPETNGVDLTIYAGSFMRYRRIA